MIGPQAPGTPAGSPGALPIAAVLDALLDALRGHRRAVLQAPPGSGKTTLVPPALMASGLCDRGEVLVLQPRRVAARTVARRIAASLGEAVGGRVGYQVRFDTCVSRETRIRVVTEGILTAWLQRDPELRGVAAVVLDEFHERSLHADLALALVREVQEALRDDLLLVVMSATLDAEPVARYLGGCPVLRSDGRLHPVAISHLPRPATGPLADTVAAGVLATVDAAPSGDVLVFLPGVREIEAARTALAARLEARGWDAAVLHGRLDAAAQDAALDPGPRPRVILATNLAETSLTIAGVAAVVDSGLVKVMRFEPGLGTGRLATERVSRASADQRAGRAGRLGPGRALRLWTAIEERTQAAFDEPEIRRLDLAAMVLDLRAWGVADPTTFPFFEPPEPERLAAAEATLRLIGALEPQSGRVTPLGERLRAVPTDPRVAAFLLSALDAGLGAEASLWAALLELGAAAGDGDLAARAREAARARGGPVQRLADDLLRAAGRGTRGGRGRGERGGDEDALARHLLAGFGDRVARRRTAGSDQVQLVGGRGARLIGAQGGASELIVALEVDGGRRGEHAESLVRAWVAIGEAALREHPGYAAGDVVRWDASRQRVVAFQDERFSPSADGSAGELVLVRRSIPLRDRDAAEALLLAEAGRDPEAALGTLDEPAAAAVARLVTFGRVYPELGLPSAPAEWIRRALPELCRGRASFEELRRGELGAAAMATLSRQERARLDAALPERLTVPSGSAVRLDYDVVGPPVLAVKVQEVFGLVETPRLADGRVPCVLHLLNPAGRPLQVTQDLRSFWTRTWPEVRAEMRSRYPKHFWPEDPSSVAPSRKTTQRSRGPA